MKRTALVSGSAALLLAVATACGSSSYKSGGSGTPSSPTTGGSTQSSAPASTAKITIASFAFSTPLTVSAGSTVTVTNTDSADHTVTADDGGFDVSVGSGQTVTFTAPAKAGTFAYHCTIHPSMHGTLIVK